MFTQKLSFKRVDFIFYKWFRILVFEILKVLQIGIKVYFKYITKSFLLTGWMGFKLHFFEYLIFYVGAQVKIYTLIYEIRVFSLFLMFKFGKCDVRIILLDLNESITLIIPIDNYNNPFI